MRRSMVAMREGYPGRGHRTAPRARKSDRNRRAVSRRRSGGKPQGAMSIRVKRVDDPPEVEDGSRVLVDDEWPSGLPPGRAPIDRWARAVAPSSDLRCWLAAAPGRFEDFADRYLRELRGEQAAPVLRDLRRLARTRTLTLVTAWTEPDRSPAAVLARLLRSKR